MHDGGKRNVLGVLVDAVDYDAAVQRIISAAQQPRGMAVAALAVHGIMTGVQDDEHRYRLNRLDLVTPDGQPVRWALNWLHRANLPDRVYGPTLMLRICEAAAREGLPIYLYGSHKDVLDRLVANLQARFPSLVARVQSPRSFDTPLPKRRQR